MHSALKTIAAWCIICAMCSICAASTPRERALALLDQMTQNEKIHMVHGTGRPDIPYAGNVPAIPRLGIPSLNMLDGPQGVGDRHTGEVIVSKLTRIPGVTAWPASLTVAASWDAGAMKQFASAMAVEQKLKGTNVMLGPCVNIARVPMGGRVFEGFGEDPFLAAGLVGPYVEGVQQHGNILANVKHLVANSQEADRYNVSENVPDRAMYEIYYPAFKAAVDAGVASVMCSYNRVNHVFACENDAVLNKGLKEYMGFEGWVVSDWDATHSTVLAANSGLDQQMPGSEYFGEALAQAIANGTVPQSRLDDMVTRILTPMYAAGLFDRPQTGNLNATVTSANHTQLAQDLAVKSTVLLKNDGDVLPIDDSPLTSIVLVGPNAHDDPVVIGGGSGTVIPPYICTPLEAFKERQVNVSYYNGTDIQAAKSAASAADYAIVFASAWSAENIDRTDLSVSGDLDTIIAAVASVQPKTIVVLNTVGAVVMPWIDSVPAVLEAWMSGQEAGHAVTRVIFGVDSPSGKLPLTFPKSIDEIPVNSTAQYPGIDQQVYFSEGLNVGYRWYDSVNVEPLFPFGHGLSYTTFDYIGLVYSGRVFSFNVLNSGSRRGSEVVQLYITYPDHAREPPRQLRMFEKVDLDAGDSTHLEFTFIDSHCHVYDDGEMKVPTGVYGVSIGRSSRDIRLTGSFTVAGPTATPTPSLPSPSPSPLPAGLGDGYIALIVIGSAFVVYCGGGVAYKSATGAKGSDRVPNARFWRGVFGKRRDEREYGMVV